MPLRHAKNQLLKTHGEPQLLQEMQFFFSANTSAGAGVLFAACLFLSLGGSCTCLLLVFLPCIKDKKEAL
jgi:hypothetical protein